MNYDIALEIFGYIGSALVLISFLLTDLKWLRAVNISGGFISLIYAICVNALPVVFLNASLITINSIQLGRILLNEKREKYIIAKKENAYNKEENEEENI